jgi:hypothetical protein
MGITATIIADSKSYYPVPMGSDKAPKLVPGVRITSFQLRYPRFIHAELMTHRVFSRNASSSRAIPVKTMLKEIINDPAMPVYWGANQKGMQANKHLVGWRLWAAKKVWRLARYPAVAAAYLAYKIGLHKQIANRICEPWAHINVLVTATDFENWYALRTHKDAQPEIRTLAQRMRQAHNSSTPKRLLPGEWHMPYLTDQARTEISNETALTVSTARCARVSYMSFDQKPSTVEQDESLFQKLVGESPLHASPAEHQAQVDFLSNQGMSNIQMHLDWTYLDSWRKPHLHGNFRGFIQHRKLLHGEAVRG